MVKNKGTTNTMEKWEFQSVSENNEYRSLLASVQMDPLTLLIIHQMSLPESMKNLEWRRVLCKMKREDIMEFLKYLKGERSSIDYENRTNSPTKGANLLGTIYADFTP